MFRRKNVPLKVNGSTFAVVFVSDGIFEFIANIAVCVRLSASVPLLRIRVSLERRLPIELVRIPYDPSNSPICVAGHTIFQSRYPYISCP